jgi:helicase
LLSRFLNADPRTLIIRVLVAAGRARGGVGGEEIIEFLESSFGVFQMKQAAGGVGGWDRHGLEAALADLAQHALVERDESGKYHLTPLGRLAGESAVEVETLIRAIDCLRPLHANEVTDPTLIAVAQTSVELDAVYFPMNKKSTQKEPQHWIGELQRQGISHTILANLRRNITEQSQATARAKKAAVCLYYVSGMSMAEIENAVGQFGGAFGGSAGPIRSVTSRTCDVLPMIARAVELLHPGVELQERSSRLLLRLDLGIPGPAVGIARYLGRDLDRADYRRLCEARLTEHDAIGAADDATLLGVLANNIRKVAILREAVARWRAARPPRAPAAALPPYQQ